MRNSLLAAALLWTAATAGWAAPKEFPMPTRSESVSELFRCVVPEDWRSEAKPAPDRGIRYTDESMAIEVIRYGLKDSKYPTPERFLESLRTGGVKLDKAGAVLVSGQDGMSYRRQYKIGGGDGPVGRTEWIFEEYVVLPQKGSFWVLKFESPSPVHQSEPEGADLWRRFLKGFRLG
ncbi:MAG: hypothetical protein A2X36_05415 [Elusimicrobia bacterium GWA2_69_24]|nr:MAG: hypothetical protein A2X36_05415 [Elusimicrobia bacterium GWA2_69_24]HBL18733.1 hypothetical protein [Elusimicrobiota bacterium]